VIIGASVSLILIVIGSYFKRKIELSTISRSWATTSPAANWARQKAVPECIHQVSELGEDT